ncbi:MAG: hypothetical protein M3Q29_12240, partial [Chloroflexota bacterium]|nr:hypothetical protein [Chloroflexota bacterium]
MNSWAQGQSRGPRRVGVPERLTRRPGRAMRCVRTLRADQLARRAGIAERGGPADEVVGQHRTAQPGAVGEEVPRGDVLEPGA